MGFLLEKDLELLSVLKSRFEKNMNRHIGLVWSDVQTRLESDVKKLAVLKEMEKTGGEPDVIGFDETSGEFIFCDCSKESPTGRRSLCYDRAALDSRKENKPANSVIDMANEIGIDLLNEEDYRTLQKNDSYDIKTSSWILTPPEIRKLGGAIFADFRYGNVFVYHNGADSYYGARGFRGKLRV